MKKDCSLIATIPSLSNMHVVGKIISHPSIAEVRFNTGTRSPYSPLKTVQMLAEKADFFKKPLWIDLKGRQLRVAVWADPLYECVELNHPIKVKLPAKMAFRNGTTVNISSVDGNKVFLMNPPREALGKGQSVNIIGNTPEILDDYLTEQDLAYLEACKQLNVRNIMASFVENKEDLNVIEDIMGGKVNICSKIESKKGVIFAGQSWGFIRCMAARDDLYIELEGNYKEMMDALKSIIATDPKAICASRIFTSLERRDAPSFADYEDLEMMYSMGYRRFMLCDNVCNYAFDKAMKAWEVFTSA